MNVIGMPSGWSAAGFYRLMFPLRELGRQRGWKYGWPHRVVERYDSIRSEAFYGRFAHLVDGEAQLIPDGARLPMGAVRRPGSPRGPVLTVKSVYDVLRVNDFDVLFMQQRAEPGWADMIRELQSQGKRVLVDSDDAWLGLPSWNPGSRRPAVETDAMLAQIAAADGLSVATPALGDMYRPYQPNVRVIRNRLDWEMWADVTPVYERPSRRLRVGWMGDTTWRAGDLNVLRRWLGPWLKRHPDVEFVAAGDPRVHDVLGIPKAQRVSVAEVAFQNMDLADITATFDIGLVPLDLSTPSARRLNECKSHLKGMEYNACGIPFIASPSESYRWYFAQLGSHGGTCVPNDPRSWREALDAAVKYRDYWGELARRGRAYVERESIQRHVSEWEDWLGADHGSHPHPARTAIAA